MNSSGQQRNLLSTSGGLTAVLILVLGLVYVARDPLKSARPISEHEILTPVLSDEWIRARLWQDPFVAVRDEIKKIEASDVDGSVGKLFQLWAKNGTEQVSLAEEEFKLALKTSCDDESTDVWVLGVMVFGGEYHEQIESRIRSRYATLSALAELGFVPDDPEHLGAIPFWPEANAESRLPLVVPYEWFTAEDDGEKRTLLVLWVLDDPFMHDPLTKLGSLLDKVKKKGGLDCNGCPGVDCECCIGNDRTVIIGPAGSTTLRAMVGEAAQVDVESLRAQLVDLTIVSPSATAAGEDWLTIEAKDPAQSPPKPDCSPFAEHRVLEDACRNGELEMGNKLARRNLVWLFKRLGVKFRSTIGTDPTLIDSLIDELDRRGVRQDDHIAVISEWDTYYGRALPGRFQQNDRSPITHPFGYMRGIDGRIPGGENGNSKSNGSNNPSSDSPQGVPEAETGLQRPTGQTQIDYLERLAGKLRDVDREIRTNDSRLRRRGLRAIGVLGSDVYDKLIIVQALRPQFRHAVFFTTDLDAGLWHPDELKFTRNMVVSSNYGLELAKRYYDKNKLPPFRDGYQTARYVATLLALDKANDYDPKDGSLLIEPRIFEIGRRGPVDLSEEDASTSCATEPSGNELYPCPSVQKSRFGTIDKVFLALALALGLLFVVVYQWKYAPFGGSWAMLWVIALALVPALFLWVVPSLQPAGGEPLTFLDGVSIWPAEAIRLVGGALGLYLLAIACRQVRVSDCELDKLWNGSGTEDPWHQYKAASAKRKRLSRAALLTMLYLAASVAILPILGLPNVPYRGFFSRNVDVVVAFGSTIPALLLLFFVLDATKLSSWLTRQLSNKEMKWPEQSFSALQELRKVCKPFDPVDKRELLGDWLTIHFIAMQTATVGRQVYYPAFVMLLLFGSRASFFDNWAVSSGLVVVCLVALGFVIFCALCLRRAAEGARSKALQRLELRIVEGKEEGDKKAAEVDVLEFAEEGIKTLATGAFMPIPQQPWLRTLLMLFGGGGSLLLFEYLVWVN